MVINDWVINNARRFPNKEGVISKDGRYTFKQLDERVNRLSNALIALGLKRGDRVAFLDRNCPQYLELCFGVTRAGMVGVPLNYRLVGREFAYLLNNSEVKAIIVGKDFIPVIDELRKEIPSVKHFISLTPAAGYLQYEDVLAASKADDPGVPLDDK